MVEQMVCDRIRYEDWSMQPEALSKYYQILGAEPTMIESFISAHRRFNNAKLKVASHPQHEEGPETGL